MICSSSVSEVLFMDYEGLSIDRLGHDSIKVRGSKVLYFDPYQLEGDQEPADIIFISHEHFDHCSNADVKRLISPSTVVVTVADCQSKLSGLEFGELKLVEPGSRIDFEGVSIEAVPAYNVDKFRAPGVPFHPKDNLWVGFVVTIDGKRIYHAGDTDKIPEMAALKDIDVALLPVSGTYVMTAVEAAEACSVISPKLAIPMHYGSVVGSDADAETFRRLAKCRVEII